VMVISTLLKMERMDQFRLITISNFSSKVDDVMIIQPEVIDSNEKVYLAARID